MATERYKPVDTPPGTGKAPTSHGLPSQVRRPNSVLVTRCACTKTNSHPSRLEPQNTIIISVGCSIAETDFRPKYRDNPTHIPTSVASMPGHRRATQRRDCRACQVSDQILPTSMDRAPILGCFGTIGSKSSKESSIPMQSPGGVKAINLGIFT